ncbi:MAG: DUF3037 domain-containing protein [Chloroflexota bacterium]
MWYSYALIRLVPRVERGEFLNVGAVVFAREGPFLAARTEFDPLRVALLDPAIDMLTVERHLGTFLAICRGDHAGGPIAALPIPERFHWLVAPRSTMIQTSPVHEGRSGDPQSALDELIRELVSPPVRSNGGERQAAGADGA